MKRHIKIMALGLALCLTLSAAITPARAANQRKNLDVTYRDIKIEIDGVVITPRDVNGKFVEPFIYQGTTYLPVRAVAEALDKEVSWDGETGTVYITTKAGAPAAPKPGDDTKGTDARKTAEVIYRGISIDIDNDIITPYDVDGNEVEPFLISGTTYLPIRAVAEACGKEVDWDDDTDTVLIRDFDRTDITVKTAAELVAAIGPNRNIMLAPGVYNLSSDALMEIENPYMYWEEVFDGFQLCVLEAANLTIRGAGDKPAELIADPRYAFVMNFVNCRNIEIDNIKAGHSEGGYCAGGVFGFAKTAGVIIQETQMYGCGTTGLNLYGVNGLLVRDSTVYECTYEIMTMEFCRNIRFENCLFRDNREYSQVNIIDTFGVCFDACEFKSNTAVSEDWEIEYPFFSVENGEDITVKDTKFTDNKAATLDGSGVIHFENCTFSGNSFEPPSGPSSK